MQLERGNWFFELTEEWSQIWTDCSWYTATLCKIEFENDAILGGYEFVAILLGVGFRVRWNHTETEDMKEIMKRVDELKSVEGAEVDRN